MKRTILIAFLVWPGAALFAAQQTEVQDWLSHEIIGGNLALAEAQSFIAQRLPPAPQVHSVRQWDKRQSRLRKDLLDHVFLRGEAKKWAEARTKVEWLETIEGGPGYQIRKLRYEALPGLWVPALLYEPLHLSAKAPVSLDVNGHEPMGKATENIQIRCINQAKRGIIALNPEWFGMGQLTNGHFKHNQTSQMDLCGTSGTAPFYLALKRGLDVLLSLEHADPARVAVSGLSGGGWQTIIISSLDPRVTLANPVAGYEGFLQRLRYSGSDIGDAEQAPCDMALYADYTHLTALRAPRPTLLTYNAKDDCCFVADYALAPLIEAANPIFQLYGQGDALRYHINYDQGHNFGQDNRQAFYRLVGDYFFPGDPAFDAREIPSSDELKTPAQLHVDLPVDNADFHSLTLALSKDLPRNPIPPDAAAFARWQRANRARLRALIKAIPYRVFAVHEGGGETNGLTATFWKLDLGGDWTVPAVELVQGEPKETVILCGDTGRKNLANEAVRLLAEGKRVLAVDPFFIGESANDMLVQVMLLNAVGQRALGIQASQVAAIARWLQAQPGSGPVSVEAIGPRSSVLALAAAGLEDKAISRLDLRDCPSSLGEMITRNIRFEQRPELCCFGLLEAFDIKQLEALIAPRLMHSQ
jgi:dienelactone hydrolase